MELLCKLRLICNELYKSTNDDKYMVISTILSKDDCFFSMDMETSLRLLYDLKIDNPLETYKILMSPDSYKEVKKIFTINA